MASTVLKELQQESKPKHKEFANLYVPFFGSLTEQDISNIAEELQCSEEEVETKLYEALKLFAVVNSITQRKLLAINGNKRLVRSFDSSPNTISTQDTIPLPRQMLTPSNKNQASDFDKVLHFKDNYILAS